MVLCCCVILQACVFRKKSQIPVFNILMPDSTTVFSTGKIPEGKVTMLVFLVRIVNIAKVKPMILSNI